MAGNSGLCASSVLEGLSCLPYSEKEREIGLALRQAALKGSEFVCQVTATGRPTAAGCSRYGRLSFPYVPPLNSTHFSLRLADLNAQSVHKVFTEHLTQSGKVNSDRNLGTLALLLTNLF